MTLRRSDYAHFHVVERGGAWLRVEGEAPLALAAGDLVVVPHGAGIPRSRFAARFAARVGYESETSFSKAFRRRFARPPGAYRRAAA